MTEEDRNHRYSTMNQMTITAGASLMITAMLGMYFPELSE
jgi:hypothetical protein